MQGKVQVYSSIQEVETLALRGTPELDYLQVFDIVGLDPVKASVSSSSLAVIDGDEITGVKVPSRNIVLTLRPNPDWSTWTYKTLRELIYKYFMPKNQVRLVFSKDGSGDPLRPTFAQMLSQNPELFQTSWIAEHDFSADVAWNPSVNTDVVAILRPEGSGGNIFAAEVYGNFTGSDEPDWSSASSIGDSIYDGDETWYNVGPASSFPPAPTIWTPDAVYGPISFVWPTVPNGHLYVWYPGYGDAGGSDEPEWPIDGNYYGDGDSYWGDLGLLHSGDVEIFGTVEDCQANSFSKDAEYIVSIICPDPYFTAIEEIIKTGYTIHPGDEIIDVVNNRGTIPIGARVKVTYGSDTPLYFQVQIDDQSFFVNVGIDATHYLDINSRPKHKFVRLVDSDSAMFTNILSKIIDSSIWPILQPGVNKFGIITDDGYQNWELRYFERFGGL